MPRDMAEAHLESALGVPQNRLNMIPLEAGKTYRATSPEEIENIIQELIANYPLATASAKKACKEWRWWPPLGWHLWAGATDLPLNESLWVQSFREELKANPKAEPRAVMRHREESGFPLFKEATVHAPPMPDWLPDWLKTSLNWLVGPGTVRVNEERVKKLAAVARGLGGEFDELSGLQPVEAGKAQGALARRITMTSYAGLAEHMQTTWTGMEAVADNTSQTNELLRDIRSILGNDQARRAAPELEVRQSEDWSNPNDWPWSPLSRFLQWVVP
jgi:hypothetical protein